MNGIDISNFQPNIDWNNLDPSIKYCYIKATEGTTYQDPLLEQHYNNANQRLKVGFYHFLVSTSSPETQAENFWNQIGNKRNDLISTLDVETNFEGLMDYVLRFIARFKALSNLPILIYTYTGFMDNLDSRLSQYKCWVANYNGGATPPTSPIWGDNYVGHQYSGNGNIQGICGDVDLNNFTEAIEMGNTSVTPDSSQIVEEVGNVDTITICKAFIGADCGKLQMMLKAIGYDLKCDNDFGEITYNAVIDYQSKRGLIVDGKAGAKTLKALGEDISKIVCGIKYKTPEATRLIQWLLNISIDGEFWTGTESEVKQYQINNGLIPDGVVGPKTWSKLLGL